MVFKHIPATVKQQLSQASLKPLQYTPNELNYNEPVVEKRHQIKKIFEGPKP